MVILTVGLNHTTAPVEIRERLHIPDAQLPAVLERLGQEATVLERLVLSTCNRVEVYAVTPDPDKAQAVIPQLLAEGTQTPLALFQDRLYHHHQEEAVRHAFRVAASLDSMVIGESQILHQVKAAYQVAQAQGATGPILNTLMTRALGVAKKVRTETGIGESPVSVPSAAIGLAKSIFGELKDRRVLILGAGEMAELAARHLQSEEVQVVLVAHRNFDRAVEVAARLQGRAVRFDQIRDELRQADIVVSSTAAPHYLLHRADVEELIRLRRNRPLFLIDIAVPRDIDPEVNQIDNVYLYDIDDLEGVVASHRQDREREAAQAELLIEREVASFQRWLKSLEVVPTIVTLRRRLEEIREMELEKALSRLQDLGPAQQEVVRTLAHGIINKILHHPTTELKRQSVNRDGLLYVSALRRLFGLQDEDR
ncbi:MAG: glutamyl-tRNA reductase [Candidatus Methylomirabilales bacterium]|nr:glutamyl-tRNA reductase [candidate division NC10 bacterium]